ncbi:hypothetical protein, conserved [Plasmodium gonderi]|uniref:Inner centromere protein ARK-binding domain-containing protein n=1 Tax=Plasmodium gonderi TaxID=77519 RepID=A0A1Y1JNA0_PLAGO|nr:hypothetical protein, conserved [Plasmodium gonderi]GAW82282.1 hypothetical protein, conserved [Plasmodium gonderi]
MLVITENALEKANNTQYPRNSRASFKRKSTQLKVISDRITPYCGETTKDRKEYIKTRKFIKESDNIKYKYLYGRKNIGNGKHERKIKLFSVEKKRNLNHLEKFSKSKKKKNQVIARRVNYNVILKNSYIKDIEHETNSFLSHLKGKKKKYHNKRNSKKDFLNIREITLDNIKDINGKLTYNLHPLSDIFQFKVDTNHPEIFNKNDTISKQLYNKKINNVDLNGKILNNFALDMMTLVVNRDRQFPSSYVNGYLTQQAFTSKYSKKFLRTNSLIDSIINLSNELNKTSEKKKKKKKNDLEYEYDKSAFHYVNETLNSHNFHYDFTGSVNKKEIKELKSIIKKYNVTSNFYFKKSFKNLEYKNKNSHKNRNNNSCNTHCYNSDYNIQYDTRRKSNSCKEENSKHIYDEKKEKKKKKKIPSLYIYKRHYSDNYFSEELKKKKEKKKIKTYFLHLIKPFKFPNLKKQPGSNSYITRTTSKQIINSKSSLHKEKVRRGSYTKRGNEHRKLANIEEKKKKKEEECVKEKVHTCNHKNDRTNANTNGSSTRSKMKQMKQKKENGFCVTKFSNECQNNFHSGNNHLQCIKEHTSIFVDSRKYTPTKENHIEDKLKKGDLSIDNTRSGKSRNTENFFSQIYVENKKWKTCSIMHPNMGTHKNVIVSNEKNKLNEKEHNLSIKKFSENADNSYVLSHVGNANSVPSFISSSTGVHKKNTSERGSEIVAQFAPIHLNNTSCANSECVFSYNSTYNVQNDIPNDINKSSNNTYATSMNMYNEYVFNMNNIKRNDSYINSSEENTSNIYFDTERQSNHILSNIYSDNIQSVSNYQNDFFKGNYNEKNIICSFGSLISRNHKDTFDIISVEKNNDSLITSKGKKGNNNNDANLLLPFQEALKSKTSDRESVEDWKYIEREDPPHALVINNLGDQKSLRSSTNSLSSSVLIKTPVVSNIQNSHFDRIPSYVTKDINPKCTARYIAPNSVENHGSPFYIFKLKYRKERLSNKTPLIVDTQNLYTTSNDIDLIVKSRRRINNILYSNKETKMNNNDNDHDFLVNECLAKCLKENLSNFRTNEDYEKYCNEDKILNPDYIPQESKRLGEKFLQNHKETFLSYGNPNFPHQPYMNNAECGNSCFRQDQQGYNISNDSNVHFMNNMKINVFNSTNYQNTDNSSFNNTGGIFCNSHINSINKEFYMKKGNDYSNDVFIKYYEQYTNKDNDKNEAKKFNYTDCYDFKNVLLNGLSREDSFDSDEDLKNEDNEMNFLKDSLNSFDNLESTEKKYEEILRDFNGKIPLLHKVLKPLPVKNRSNNFDICLYLLQKHGGDLNNEENICILRDKEIVQHSAIYDTKKGCIKSNITNVTNIKLYHPKWYSKKKIIERLKEQSCFNPFTIFGSAPSLLDFDEVFDKDVYNKFVSRNSRKSHSLLRILAKQKVINNLNDKITDKEWPQVHSYLKKRWSKETNIELNWACDPLLYEELEWYLSTNNEYLNMTDKVADIEVCYCPTLDPSSYYAWNDSRVIYTNLCYNKSKEDAEPTSHSVKDRFMVNNNAELKNKDKQVSFRKRASGCEHLMFHQNLMKRKKLSKKKKKLLKKKKKMLKERDEMLRQQNKMSSINNNGDSADAKPAASSCGLHMETKGDSENAYRYVYSSSQNNNKFSNDPCMNMNMRMNMDMRTSALKTKKNNRDSSYYPNIFSTKKKKSVHHNKNYEDDVIPIMTVNTSLYRNNIDNKYNCSNTAYDYIKNKDNTIKFFASPKKTRKNNSIKKSVKNSDNFYFLNSSMINSDNIYNNNNLNSFDSRDSAEGNDSTSIFHKGTFGPPDDNIRSKNQAEATYVPTSGMEMDKLDSASERIRKNLQMNEHTCYSSSSSNNNNNNNNSNNNNNNNNSNKNHDNGIYEFKCTKNVYDLRTYDNDNNENSSMGHMARINENFSNKSGNFFHKGAISDFMQPFHHMDIGGNKYGNGNSNVNMNIFSNIRMYEQNFNQNRNHADNNSTPSMDYNIGNKGNDNIGIGGPFTKKNFVDKSYYGMDQINFSSKNMNNFSSKELGINELQYDSIFRNNLSKHNIWEQNKKKLPTRELKEKNMNKFKETRAEHSDDNHNENDNKNSDENDTGNQNNYNLFECKYENNSNKCDNRKSGKIIAEYFLNKNSENYFTTQKKKKMNDGCTTGEPQKSMGNDMEDMNALKTTQQNIDKKNMLEKKIQNNMSFHSKKKNTDNSTSTFNSKRSSNSNISIDENRKIRRYINKICQDDNTSIEYSENSKGHCNKGSVEPPSSRTSETSSYSAFKMATSVFKKLF